MLPVKGVDSSIDIYNYTKLIWLGADDQPVKVLPKDPSEGGVWTVSSPAYDQPIKCIKVNETSWRGQISNNKYASVQYSSDSGYTVSYVNDESTGDAMGTIFSDAQFTDTNLQNENITATWSPE